MHIPTQMRPLAGGRDRVDAPGATLRQIIDALEAEWPGMREQLVEGESIRPQLAVSIDGAVVESGLVAPVHEDAEIFFIPAIGGGASAVARLISFDIDGTLEIGDPPGLITLAAVRRAHDLGVVVGSCSDRPVSWQRALWEEHDLPMQFTVLKQHLRTVRAEFDVDHYLHVGDTEVDEMMAQEAGFDFLHSIRRDAEELLLAHLNGGVRRADRE